MTIIKTRCSFLGLAIVPELRQRIFFPDRDVRLDGQERKGGTYSGTGTASSFWNHLFQFKLFHILVQV